MRTGTPGRIAFAAPRLGVPGRSAPRERTPDPQVRSQAWDCSQSFADVRKPLA